MKILTQKAKSIDPTNADAAPATRLSRLQRARELVGVEQEP